MGMKIVSARRDGRPDAVLDGCRGPLAPNSARRPRRAAWKAALCLAGAMAVPAPARPSRAEPVRVERSEPHMGTLFRIVVHADSERDAERAVAAAFARIADLDERLSDYRADSELMRLCDAAPHAEPVEVSRDLWEVLDQAGTVSVASEGAFDPTVGQLTKLWRRARRQHALPDSRLLADALRHVDYRQVERDAVNHRIRLARPGVRLDLGGIAKGFAAERACAALKERGVPRASIDAGGGLTVGDPPPGETGWTIGIAGMRREDRPVRFVRIANRSIATSGDLSQFLDIDGVRYSHILDPRTGIGLTRRISATVIARDGGLADALATALCVLGPEKGVALARRFDADCLILRLDGESLRPTASPGFSKWEIEAPARWPTGDR